MTDWPRIVDEHGGAVWRTVRKLVADDHAAADCFQETFVAAWKAARQRPVHNWPAFLTHLATARGLDYLRKRRRQAPGPSLVMAEGERLSPSRPPLEQAQESELFDRLREALAALPDDHAQVCCLRFLEELSYEQIADQLGITVNHVGVLLHRAKSELRQLLAPFDPSKDSLPATDEVRP